MKHFYLLAVSGLLVLMFILGLLSMLNDSGIVDEVAHIPAGYSYLKFHDFRLNPEHPPLIKNLSALPLLFMNLKFPLDHLSWASDVNGQWESGWHFIYHIGNDADKILFWARLPILLLALLLGIFIFKWTSELLNKRAGLLALFLYALSPNIIAHSRLVTTDLGIAAFIFIACYYFMKFLKQPTRLSLIIAGLTFGLAQLAKFSAFLLIPLFGFIIIWLIFTKSKQTTLKPKTLIASLLLIFIIGYLLVGVFYYLNMYQMSAEKQRELIDGSFWQDFPKKILYPLTDHPILRPYAQYLLGLFMVFQRVAGGNTTFFMGEVSNQSFRLYFPVVFLIKTPLPTLILIFFSLCWAGWFLLKKRLKLSQWRADETLILAFIFLYTYTSVTGNLNIGLRHLFPIMPFVFSLVGKTVIDFMDSQRQRLKTRKFFLSLLIILLGWLTWSNFNIFPHYVAYFNEIINGPQNGYRYVTDSSLDWGQDLRRLKKWVDDNKIEKIKIDYFGGADPKYYFCERLYDEQGELIPTRDGYDCSRSPYEEWHALNGPIDQGWIAVSATFLQNSLWFKLTANEPDYDYLRQREPDVMIGYSILVYHLK